MEEQRFVPLYGKPIRKRLPKFFGCVFKSTFWKGVDREFVVIPPFPGKNAERMGHGSP
jgi:hypothetical protein